METTTALGASAGTGAFNVLGEAVQNIWTWFFDMAVEIFSNPILLIPLAIFVIGATIGLVKRVIG